MDAWERQPGESAQAYEAFCAYRDLGPGRSMTKAARALGRSGVGTLEKHSVRWTWVHRAELYDAENDRAFRHEMATARREMARRHARVATAALGKAVQRLQSLTPENLNARDVATWIEMAAKLERAALGEPDRLEVSGPGGGPVEVSHLTDEERRARLAQLRSEIDSRLRASEGGAGPARGPDDPAADADDGAAAG